ncbi:MAG: hexulose-6-phosphate synthase [candidate division TM6 bacterium GW2011_GWF2_32_72]|nr:MAG: hexulose-6-phosphate synthase [candidate division TM6 bacterium GW2011_GWF2_32_72]
MKFQVSFDLTDLDKALDVAHKIEKYVDIFEIGTIMLFKYGIEAINAFNKAFPEKTLLADTKIIDRGKDITNLITSTAITWITVMAGTNKDVIHSATTTAHNHKSKVMLDLLDTESIGQSAMDAKNQGIDALLFHKSHDANSSLEFLDHWDMVRGNTDLPIFVSATITRETIDQILELKPDGIIIGKSITDADNPAVEAEFYYNKIFQK